MAGIDNNESKSAVTGDPDPKHVVIVLYPEGFQHNLGAWGAKTVSNPTVYDLADNGTDSTTAIYDKLLEHVRKYGTIDEIVIGGHGAGAQAMMGSKNFNYIHTVTVLDIIDLIEKELDHKVTNRLVFSGCSVFSQLPSENIKYYRDFSYDHKMEIVGSTSMTGSTVFGRYVQFTPMGDVVRDKLDSKWNPLADINYDPSWVQYHLGKTQKEGEKAQIEAIISDVRTLVNAHDLPTNIQYDPRHEMRQNLAKKDKVVERVSVLLSEDEWSAITADATGMVRSFGTIAPHPMTEAEKQSDVIRRMEMEVRNRTFDESRGIAAVQERAKFYSDYYKVDFAHLVTAVALDDGKRALLVTGSGGYEVIDFKFSEETPVPVMPPQPPSAPSQKR